MDAKAREKVEKRKETSEDAWDVQFTDVWKTMSDEKAEPKKKNTISIMGQALKVALEGEMKTKLMEIALGV